MRPLADADFNPSRPLQTKRGAGQALRCGHNAIDELIKAGVLEVVYFNRIPKITTTSILKVAAAGTPTRRPPAPTGRTPG